MYNLFDWCMRCLFLYTSHAAVGNALIMHQVDRNLRQTKDSSRRLLTNTVLCNLLKLYNQSTNSHRRHLAW